MSEAGVGVAPRQKPAICAAGMTKPDKLLADAIAELEQVTYENSESILRNLGIIRNSIAALGWFGVDVSDALAVVDRIIADVKDIVEKLGWEIIVVAPTCTEDGYTFEKHRDGRETEKIYDEGSALGHDVVRGEIILAPNCLDEGLLAVSCSRCDWTDEEIIPANGHAFDAVPGDDQYDTVYTCSVCGYSYTATDWFRLFGDALDRALNGGLRPEILMKYDGKNQTAVILAYNGVAYVFIGGNGETSTKKIVADDGVTYSIVIPGNSKNPATLKMGE
jgi:hypothetical protein